MSKVGDKALNGIWEHIAVRAFEIKKQMTMSYDGVCVNVIDDKEQKVATALSGKGKIHVHPGYKCYVIQTKVKFDDG
jgi:hypothetical protein